MSKRFGRNQRRRAREAIASLTEAYTRESALLAHVSEKRRELEDEIAEAKTRAADLSVIFQPKTIETQQQRAGRLQWLIDYLPSFDSLVRLEDPMPLKAALNRVPLELMIESVHRDVMNQALHANVLFSGKEGRYGISRLAIDALRHRDVERMLAREMAPRMARLFADELKGKTP